MEVGRRYSEKTLNKECKNNTIIISKTEFDAFSFEKDTYKVLEIIENAGIKYEENSNSINHEKLKKIIIVEKC